MVSTATPVTASPAPPGLRDDRVTVSAISALAFMLSDVLHEGLGHACVALATVAPSGVISTVAWSSAYDSKLVDAGGTLVNLAAAGVFWVLLWGMRRASAATRLFLLLGCAFNLFDGTGYFFFSGVTNYGDWAGVIAGLQPYTLWRVGLIVVGILLYWGAVVVVGSALVRYLGVARNDGARYWRLTITSYMAAVVVNTLGGVMFPEGGKYVLISSLPASLGANCGLLWMRYYVPGRVVPQRDGAAVDRNWALIGAGTVAALAYILVLGRGIPLHR
jgi:hypothetical protein